MASALITGASSGIGQAIAAALLDDGWGVTAVARNPARAGLVGAHEVICDVTDEQQVEQAVAAHHARFGELTLLVNAAGIGIAGPVETLSARRFDRQFAVNVRGVFLVSRAAIPMLRESRGWIINVASILGLEGDASLPAYAASKHAVVGLTRSIAAQLDSDGVRVTALCPGFVNTPMTDWVKDRLDPDAMIQPADCVRAVRFLLGLSAGCRVPELVLDGPRPPGI